MPFTPTCLSCRYQLTGIADPSGKGICPECGAAFDIAQLERLELARRRRVRVIKPTPAWLIILACFICLTCPIGIDRRDAYGLDMVLLTAWVFGCIWTFVRRRWVFAGKYAIRIVWVACPVARFTFLWGSAPANEFPTMAFWTSAVGVAAMVVLWRLTPERSRWPLVGLAGTTFMIPGLAMALTTWAELQAGWEWSMWQDPRWTQPYDQYPLTTSEALRVGVALLGSGAGCLVPCVLHDLWVVFGRYTPSHDTGNHL